MNLEEIYEPIKAKLYMVDQKLRDEVLSANQLHQLNEYILKGSGKRLRPALVILSAKTGDQQPDKAIQVGVAVEIIHTATLIHDDVVDKANLRRGRETIRSKWGSGLSIILGDYWFSEAFSILSREVPEVIKTLMKVINTMCLGELEQLKRCYDPSLTEGEYFRIVEKKTASLMSSCCELGAEIGGASGREVQSLANYGLNLGIAFQVADDCLDLVGSEKKMGKTLGSDLTEGRLTLPLIHTISVASKKDREWIEKVFASREINENTLNQIGDMVRQYGGVEYALRKADEYKEIAKNELKSLTESVSRTALSLITDYVVKRVIQKSQWDLNIEGAKSSKSLQRSL